MISPNIQTKQGIIKLQGVGPLGRSNDKNGSIVLHLSTDIDRHHITMSRFYIKFRMSIYGSAHSLLEYE